MKQRNDLYNQVIDKFERVDFECEPVKIFHIRDEKDQYNDVWNDYLGFIDKDKNVWLSIGTTDPGSNAYHRHSEGAAHMCLGLHKEIWVIDIHCKSIPIFAHEALCSRPERGCEPIKYWRDSNQNRIYDSNELILDNFIGINCHRASARRLVATIGDYSDACQVRQDINDHLLFMDALKQFDEVKATKKDIGVYNYKFSCLLTLKQDWSNL